jgi:hypothetical protein
MEYCDISHTELFCNVHLCYKGSLEFWLGGIKTLGLLLIIEVTNASLWAHMSSVYLGSYGKRSICLGKSVVIKRKE